MIAEIRFICSLFGVRFWEVDVTDGSNKHQIRVYLKDMKRLEVAKSLNSTRKVETWLNNTDAGQDHLAEKIGKAAGA